MGGVLLTGASGFIGLPVAAALAERGEEVHAFSTRAHPPAVRGVCWHDVDLADRQGVEAAMAKLAPARLIHLAWYTEHDRFWRAPENLEWVARSLWLVRAFVACGGRRMVALGTCAEYDWSATDGPLREDRSPLHAATLYGASKDVLRRVGSAYADQEGVELAWGRMFFAYGPREARSRLVPSVICSLLSEQAVATSSGSQICDFMHVEDVAGALVALLDSRVVGPVNIASGVGVTVGEIVERIGRLVGRPELIGRGRLPNRGGEPPLLVADVSRLRDQVGYLPRWELAAGLADTVSWWERHR
jgi:nucleoside-diphosphate-sugar epimerase